MEFETVERCGRVHVVKNGVESAAYVQRVWDGWRHFIPDHIGNFNNLQTPLEIIASQMDDWYTVQEAAVVLVELGVFDTPPSAQAMAGWCREGKLPGAFKLCGRGTKSRGSGGSWRIPEKALVTLAEARREKQ